MHSVSVVGTSEDSQVVWDEVREVFWGRNNEHYFDIYRLKYILFNGTSSVYYFTIRNRGTEHLSRDLRTDQILNEV